MDEKPLQREAVMRIHVLAAGLPRARALAARLARLGGRILAADSLDPAGFVPTEADLLVVAVGSDGATVSSGSDHRRGLELLLTWRARHALLPVLAMAAGTAVEDRIEALDAGADDCVTDAVDDAELAARLRACLRRGRSVVGRRVRCGPLVYDFADRTFYLNDEPLRLSVRELEVLEALMRRPGHLVNPDTLMGHWVDRDEPASANTVQVHVCRLRRKLRPASVRIHTVRGLGYCLGTDPKDPPH